VGGFLAICILHSAVMHLRGYPLFIFITLVWGTNPWCFNNSHYFSLFCYSKLALRLCFSVDHLLASAFRGMFKFSYSKWPLNYWCNLLYLVSLLQCPTHDGTILIVKMIGSTYDLRCICILLFVFGLISEEVVVMYNHLLIFFTVAGVIFQILKFQEQLCNLLF
jgi:hypothetical protein